jgi:hypothetical protein
MRRMKFPLLRPVGPLFLGACVAVVTGLCTPIASATDFTTFGDPGHWRVVVSPFTQHWRYSVEHRPVYALGVERQRDDHWLGGAAYFRNSFGQPSAYVYLGKRYDGFFGRPELFAQVTAGVIYGYKGKFKNKLPLNTNGFAPGAVISGGWQFNQEAAVSWHLLGDAAVMFQFSWDFR